MKNWVTSKFMPWKMGDKVWLEGKNLHLHYPTRKLVPRRKGPFEISQVISPLAYHLQLPPTWKIHNVFHVSLLSTYCETAEHGPNYMCPPPKEIDREEEYEIAEILSHQGSPGHHSYLVSWKRYSLAENTWEPEWNLQYAQTIFQRYKQWTSL